MKWRRWLGVVCQALILEERGDSMEGESSEQTAWLARTYRLDPATVAMIDGLAAAYGAPQSRIVAILIRIGFEELEAGRRFLQRRPIRYAVELRPKG